jgi:hypothetical protein
MRAREVSVVVAPPPWSDRNRAARRSKGSVHARKGRAKAKRMNGGATSSDRDWDPGAPSLPPPCPVPVLASLAVAETVAERLISETS